MGLFLVVLGGRSWCKLCSEVVRGDDERGVVRSLFIDLEDVSSMLWNLGLEMSDYYRLFMDARKLSTRDMD